MMESRIQRLATMLMDATTDPDPEVQEQLRDSLCALGGAEPEETLRCCREYLTEHHKLPYPHRALILRAMESVIRNHLQDLGKTEAVAVIALASHEMTKSKEPIREWQEAAGAVLVALGRRFLNAVMEEALSKFQPGILPQPGLLRALAELAAANVFGMVPFLNSILGTLLPMLPLAKADSMKIECCYALQRFSESIQEYVLSPELAPDPTIRRDSFGPDLGSAFELLQTGPWLHNKHTQVRQAALEALGALSSLIPPERLEEQIPKLLPVILGMFRKQTEPLPVSKSLSQILESSVSFGSRSLEAQLEPLLGALLNQLCAPVDPADPSSARNRSELLRCFTVLAAPFPDRLLQFLVPRLESGSERIRVGSLLLLRHLINSAPSQMEMKKPFILNSMKLPLQDGSPKVRIALVQLISAMAHHGFLEQSGGEILLEFLIRQCALPAHGPGIPDPADSEDLSLSAVRGVSEETLLLLSTTVHRITHVLWPLLLQFLLSPELIPALPALCRSLTIMAKRIPEEIPEKNPPRGNVPSPQALITRLLVVSSQPFLDPARGVSALRLLRELRLHPDLEKLWNREIPELLRHLEENPEGSLCQWEWEEKLLQFFRESLESIADKSWIFPLVPEISRQLRGSESSQEKDFLYRCLGTALGICPGKELVGKEIRELLENARYQHESDREGVASCLGICARSHLEETLEKLEEFEKSEIFRKSPGLFSIFKDRSDVDAEKARSCLVLCWGRVAAAAPWDSLRSRLEFPILQHLLQHLHTKVLGIKVETKDLDLKLSLSRSVAAIARALHTGNSGNSGNVGNVGNSGNSVGIARKAELVALMVEFLGAEAAEAPRTRLRQRALEACAHLLALEPPLSDAERSELLDTALSSVLGLPPPENQQQNDLLGDALGALSELLRNLLRRRLHPHGLQDILGHLEPWVRSRREQERERALALSAALLEFFWKNLRVSSLTPFHCVGSLLALFSPRCCDEIPQIRADSVECVRTLLYIQLGYEGFSRDHRDELLEELRSLKAELENPDSSVLFHVCNRMATVLCQRLPPEQLWALLFSLLDSFRDPLGSCARGASVLINGIVRQRGALLGEKVPSLLGRIRSELELRPEEALERGLRSCQRSLGLLHPQIVTNTLLESPLPLDSPSCLMWRSLGSDPSLTPQILELLLEKLSREIPYKERKFGIAAGPSERTATPLTLAVTSALAELLAVPEAEEPFRERFAELFQALLLQLGSSAGLKTPKSLHGPKKRGLQPCRLSLLTLQSLLSRVGLSDVVGDVGGAGGWELMETPERHHDGVALLAGSMARLCGARIPRIVRNLLPVLGSSFESQRVTGTAFLAELPRHPAVAELIPLEPLLEALAALEKDPAVLVRLLALRAIGNIAHGAPEKLRRLGPQLSSWAICGLDDGDAADGLALESMESLARIVRHLEEPERRSVLLPVAVRIRPFFDSDSPCLRRSSLSLFGILSDCCGGAVPEPFRDQILTALVPLLLHLQDPCPDVSKACRIALRMCATGLGCEEIWEKLGNERGEERGGIHYGEFINHLCKSLVRCHPSRVSPLLSSSLFYFKSPWRELRAAAPMLVGFLVLHMDEEQAQQVDLDELISALKLLLKDPVPAVRIKAAETLGRLVHLL